MTNDSAAKLPRSLLEFEAAFGVEELPITRRATSARQHDTRAAQLDALQAETALCTACPLYQTRTHLVFGVGNPAAELVFVGEAPGREEDRRGQPFVGAAGTLLTKMIEAIGMRREDVYICNVLKDRPPSNRPPQPEEVAACRHWLETQLRIIHPRILCTLGKHAAMVLIAPNMPIMQTRGTWHAWEQIPVMPTLHPAYLLRNASAKKLVWHDLKAVRDRLRQPR